MKDLKVLSEASNKNAKCASVCVCVKSYCTLIQDVKFCTKFTKIPSLNGVQCPHFYWGHPPRRIHYGFGYGVLD